MNNDVASILLTEEQLQKRVAKLGATISGEYAGRCPLFIGILKGSFIFMADLVREITIPCEMEFMAVSSYGSRSTTTGAVKITRDLAYDIEGRDIIIVEDILDSGRTLHYLVNYLSQRNPASIRICTLLDKPERREVEVAVDYVGFAIPDAFVVGYGLDYAEKYRNLPYLGVLSPSVYEGE